MLLPYHAVCCCSGDMQHIILLSMEILFCRRCGQKVAVDDAGVGRYRCAGGHILFYKSYNSTLAAVLNRKGELLVAIRGKDPGKGTVDLPGGFVDIGESFEQAIVRELQEEAGLTRDMYGELSYLCDAVDGYDFKGETLQVNTLVFTTRIRDDVTVAAADDVAELRWLSIDKIDPATVHPTFEAVRLAFRTLAADKAHKT